MKYKKTIILLLIAVFLLSITCVSASEIDNTIPSEDTNTVELSTDNDIIEDNLQTTEENDELTLTNNNIFDADSSTYSNLAEEISQSGNIKLTHKNYTYDDGATAITIDEENKVIDGDGAVIDMAGSTIRAFYVTASGVTIKNLTIKNANYNGQGGTIYFSSYGTVTNCNFTDNKATGDNSEGGAVFFETNGEVTNCNFTDNSASYGGAVWMASGNVSNCNFVNNTASEGGGAIRFSDAGTVTNCNFAGNNAITGSAIYFWSSSDTKTVSNSIFLNNRANAEALEITENNNNITITFTGNNSLLNAIYSNGDVSFTNVTYWSGKELQTLTVPHHPDPIRKQVKTSL